MESSCPWLRVHRPRSPSRLSRFGRCAPRTVSSAPSLSAELSVSVRGLRTGLTTGPSRFGNSVAKAKGFGRFNDRSLINFPAVNYTTRYEMRQSTIGCGIFVCRRPCCVGPEAIHGEMQIRLRDVASAVTSGRFRKRSPGPVLRVRWGARRGAHFRPELSRAASQA